MDDRTKITKKTIQRCSRSACAMGDCKKISLRSDLLFVVFIVAFIGQTNSPRKVAQRLLP